MKLRIERVILLGLVVALPIGVVFLMDRDERNSPQITRLTQALEQQSTRIHQLDQSLSALSEKLNQQIYNLQQRTDNQTTERNLEKISDNLINMKRKIDTLSDCSRGFLH